MSCKPLDLLELAEKLAQFSTDQNDVSTRSSISRAYYASLHEIENSFEVSTASEIINASSHQKIIERAASYGRSIAPGRTVAGRIAKFAHKLRVERNKADYELLSNISSDKATEALASARLIFSLCEEIKNKRVT